MQIFNSNPSPLSAYKQNETTSTNQQDASLAKQEQSVEEIMEDSAYKVSLSLNAQIVLMSLNVSSMVNDNTAAQGALTGYKDVLDFLSGKTNSDGYDLSSIGYEGKPIMELTPDEASELVGENGYFGVTQTSDRVANFVLGFAGDDLELLEEGRKGVVQGFEEAEKLFGGELPEISYQTQERTLALIDAKIAELTGSQTQEQ